MEIYKKYFSKYYSELILLSIIFFFFFQLITDFIESIYALNLIEVEFNENVAAALFLLTPIVLFFFKKGVSEKLMVILGEILIICRVLIPFFDSQVKIIFAGLGVGCFMIFFPALLQKKSRENAEEKSLLLGVSLGGALISLILFKTLGSTLDLTFQFWFLWIGWILAVIAGLMLFNLINKESHKEGLQNISNVNNKIGNKWRILGLSLGIISVIALIYFVYGSPAVIARWTEGDYISIIIILTLMNTLFLFLILFKPDLISKITPKRLLICNLMLVITLVLTIAINQIPFAFVSYPIYASTTTILFQIPLYIMLIFSPIILIDFIVLLRELFRNRPSTRKIGVSFFIASVVFLLMTFSVVFTVVWDYIPYVGFLFRDMLWVVFLIIGAFMGLPLLLVKKESLIFIKRPRESIKSKLKVGGLIGILCIGTIIGVIILQIPVKKEGVDNPIRILSYNIQQGFDEDGNKNFEGQLDVILNATATIIGLQESDTCRVSTGNNDIVRYINNRLKYYSYFGPKTVTGTYGLALLSKYPIKNAKTFYMESKGEQTAAIEAQITVGTRTYNVYVTHLGNFVDPTVPPFDTSQLVQQEQVLERIGTKENVILMGDFNFDNSTQQYTITTALLNDIWVIADKSTVGNVPKEWQPPELPNNRIDHVFISPDLTTLSVYIEVSYFGGTASDHPALLASIQL
jgi:endonuclease/exonuclease/phosphatase family metal-dependent hydrolase